MQDAMAMAQTSEAMASMETTMNSLPREYAILPDASIENLVDCPLNFPPSFPRNLKKKGAVLQDPDHKNVFESILSGNFTVEVRESPTVLALTFKVPEYGAITTRLVIKVEAGCIPGEKTSDDSPMKSMPYEVANRLHVRLVHLFLRQHCSKLIFRHSCLALFGYVLGCHGEDGQWNDNYDLSVVRSVWCYQQLVNGENPDEYLFLAQCLGDTCEALEACLKFNEAGDLYVACAKLDVFSSNTPQNTNFRSIAIGNGGLAKKRSLNFEEAEALYIESIAMRIRGTHSGKPWDPNEDPPQLFNLLRCYYDWIIVLYGDGKNVNNDKLVSLGGYFKVFAALLFKAKVRDFPIECVREDIDDFELYSSQILKQKFQKPKNAVRALRELFFQGKTVAFRTFLMGLTTPGAHSFTINIRGRVETINKDAKLGSRNVIPTRIGVDHCCNCSQAGEGYKACPCKRARYCSKDCQRQHWPVHKKECLHYQQRCVKN